MPADLLRWYRSKVDWWLAVVLCLPPAAAATVCVAAALSGTTAALLAGLAILLLEVGLYFGVFFPLRYGLGGPDLLVRFGLCRLRVPLGDISEVRPTRNPLSSPALSLDRLLVMYGRFGDAVMISPADRDRFLDDLASTAGLRREGDRLTRVPPAAE
jgi:hypothetical protein